MHIARRNMHIAIELILPLTHTQQPQVMSKRFVRRKSRNTKRKSSNLKLTWHAKAWTCQSIVNAVDEEWISERHDEDIGYQAVEPLELLELLCDAGGDFDDLEITDLNTKMLEPWDGVEAPVTTFGRADKHERQLERHSIPKQPELRLLYAVSTYQTSGQFDTAMREWHAKVAADKTFPKFRVYIQNKYTKQVKRNRSTVQTRQRKKNSRMPRLKPWSSPR